MVALVYLDAAVHIGRRSNLAFRIKLQLRVNATNVLAADQRDSAESCTHSEVLPVLAGYLGGAQSAGEDGNLHLHLLGPAILGLGVHGGEDSWVGVALNTGGRFPRFPSESPAL